MGWSNRTHHPVSHLALDLRRLYHHLLRSVGLPMDGCHPRHPLEKYRTQLP